MTALKVWALLALAVLWFLGLARAKNGDVPPPVEALSEEALAARTLPGFHKVWERGFWPAPHRARFERRAGEFVEFAVARWNSATEARAAADAFLSSMAAIHGEGTPSGEPLGDASWWVETMPGIASVVCLVGETLVCVLAEPVDLAEGAARATAAALSSSASGDGLLVQSTPGGVVVSSPGQTTALGGGVRAAVWVRAREAAEAMGLTVSWREETREAIFAVEGRVLVVRPSDTTATLGGQPFPLEGTPYIENDRLILPLSALTQAFGLTLTEGQAEPVTYRVWE